jgi:hypothetical protein
MSSVWNVRPTHKDRDFKIVCNKCDICDGRISCSDNVESEIDMLDEIDNSYESEYDKHEPRLLLCDSCKKEFQIPGYPVH